MRLLFYITVAIVGLYLVYRLLGVIVLPQISMRRFERYKRDFFAKNPHIDPQRYEDKMKADEEKCSIIDKRKDFRIR